MSEDADFDTEIDAAWERFCARLCTYLENMETGDLLTICPGGGKRRDDLYLTVANELGGRLVGDAAMNGPLAAAVSYEHTTLLAEQGWTEYDVDDGPQRTFRVEARPHALAQAVVVLIRDVRGIAHPTFLAASAVGAPVTRVFDSGSQLKDWTVDPLRARLVAEVDTALESITGSAPVRDDDGDVMFEAGRHTAYARILDKEPVVELYAVFAIHTRAPTVDSVVVDLSTSWPDIKFLPNHTHVVASTRIDCAPVVEEHLGRRLGMFLKFVEQEGDEITVRLSRDAGMRVPTHALLSDQFRRIRLADMDAASLTFTVGYEARELGFSSPMLHDAMALAAAAHLHQRRAGSEAGSDPYIVHPLRNVLRLVRFGCTDEVVLVAAALHDTVEDQTDRIVSLLDAGTPATHDNALAVIARHFSPSVSDVVASVTNPPTPHGLSINEKNRAYAEHVAAAITDPRVFLVKLSDFIDNAGSVEYLADESKRIRLRDKYSPMAQIFLDARETLGDSLNLTAEGTRRLDARLGRLARALG
ncbi:HD domain-containing protein [Rhodococcus sp. BP-252]|uniref:T3SS (YopN, CesT) and YbjN peptide-binding chaperone 1 n=1 Tax=unclassified Rhodococcus (in: high G+C Gram-positive bacteria) TaxID=192944 RepID=UPI001C9A7C83|nr:MULTISPECIES: HD domain-containing protein [unclassified Rhodococcus (in: high G+C Gram-positive bacteria)]MBY6414140.1 HD domain-containing protein [Rhodococcus sp. BP-320]MBY6418885.1 HD domain-containing protein [Rhodococcus sp. BP-321]MBY6423582.1 HD domain-containing protein [Rhodococcus sp. BP-324]MBY6428919.1 HD domain-containing protein [Rhodococcus sp. BP-323]MBY6433924.1 HD domain-containing protein [Rhodococcus sp. BP-322]